MKRSLILLLVVALVATMVPTIALAAGSGTVEVFEVAMPIVRGFLSRTSDKGDQNQVVTHWPGDGDGQLIWSRVSSGNSSDLKFVWTTSDRNIVGFADEKDHNYIIQEDISATGKTPFPELDGRGIGIATITGKAYWKEDPLTHNPTVLATTSFQVELKPVWESKVTIENAKGEEQVSQTYKYWLTNDPKYANDISSVTDIPDHGRALEARAHVHFDAEEQEKNPNNWAATYGVSELVWTSSDESIAKVDKHGRVWFTGKDGKVTITATAKELAEYPHTPKSASITYIIEKATSYVDPGKEEFTTVNFTADELGVKRNCSKDYVNIARFLELYPRPITQYQGSTDHDDVDGGNYGVDDDIIWTSSNENLMWICRDANHYNNGIGPNWQECYVEVSDDAKPGDKVTITATSKNNPNLSDTIVLVLKVDDTRTVTFERTSVTVRESENVTVKVLGNDWTAGQLWNDRHVTLTSLNPDIARATMGSTGVTITGVEPGTTTITLESAVHKFKASIDVTVVPRNGVKSVTVPKRYKNITMPLYDVGEKAEVDDNMNTTRVRVNINPNNAWYRATWTSSDPSVAYIVYDGDADYGEAPTGNIAVVRAAGVGKCKITVTIDDGIKTFKRSMKITVVKAKATKLALNKTKANFYLRKGGDNTLQLIATDKKTDEAVPVTWTSSDKTIAKVSKTGLVTLKKEGTVKITAVTKDGYKAEKTCTITVKKLPVRKIVVDSKKMTMKVGETSFVQYRVNAKAYNQAVSFKSSDKKVVKVDKYGNLKALKAGKAEITITAKDGSGVTAKVIITVKGVAENTDTDVVEVVEDDSLELTLDGIDGIEDLGIEDEVVLDNNEVIELAID